jgi:site-specific recombinase XerD
MKVVNDRAFSRDAIERFLDRGWILDHTPVHALKGHRFALGQLDDWLQKNRVATLTTASTSDLRALLDSAYWDRVSRCCESLLGLVTRFYRSLMEWKFRPDDPVERLIEEELAAAARKRSESRPSRPVQRRRGHQLHPRTV